jgi:short-chain fatty acids transporter
MKKHKLSVPDPLILALGLTGLTIILALVFGDALRPRLARVADVLVCWTEGFWELLAFSMQMVLILLLGYMLALSPALDCLSSRLSGLARNPVCGTVLVTVISLLFGWLNWGLALVFGAILVKKIAEQAIRTGSAINYPLLGAWSVPLSCTGLKAEFLFYGSQGRQGQGDKLIQGNAHLLAFQDCIAVNRCREDLFFHAFCNRLCLDTGYLFVRIDQCHGKDEPCYRLSGCQGVMEQSRALSASGGFFIMHANGIKHICRQVLILQHKCSFRAVPQRVGPGNFHINIV